MTRQHASPPTEAEMLDLTVAIESLAEEIHVLRQALDEFRQDFAWMLNSRDEFRCQHSGEHQPVMHITSMPKDALAPDFHERVNRYSSRDLPKSDMETPAPAVSDEDSEQGTLW